jgi:uncharacterized protein YbaR (Trm112 family)
MLDPATLALFRCPLDPSHTRLEQADAGLVCQRCRLVYPVTEGIPRLLPEEAKLPEGCASLAELPCQKEKS